MAGIEVRIYTIQQGKRDEFVKLYDEVLLEAVRSSGEERQRKGEEFYGSDMWRTQLGPRANPLLTDTSNGLVVQLTPGSAIQ